MNKLPNHTALKEWASAIEALGRGEQVILIRKGGIADPTFGVEAEKFYLFPTYFHQVEPPATATVSITHWCEVVQTWRIRELELLRALEPFVVFPRATLEERYRFRPDQALHVIGVRVWRLPSMQSIAPKSEYAGCRSWVSVDEEIAIDGSEAVLSDEALAAKLADVAAALGQ